MNEDNQCNDCDLWFYVVFSNDGCGVPDLCPRCGGDDITYPE